MADQHPILICYDGSEHARHAIERAGELVRPGPAVVIYAWQPLAVIMARSGFGALAGRAIVPDEEAEEQQEAEKIATEGGELARAAGFDTEARHRRAAESIAQAILETAGELDASLLVMGSRGLTGLRSALLGSVSHALVIHAHRPVLVVPAQRHEHDA